MPQEPNTTAVTEEPNQPEAARIKRQVQQEGGRAHEIAHADREYTLNLPSKLTGKMKPTSVAKCGCGRSTVVTLPDVPGSIGGKDIRACIVCDALPNWPRYQGPTR